MGLGAGATLSVLAGVIWLRRTKEPRFALGIVAGLVFSVMAVSLTVPSLRMLLGALPTYRVGSDQPLGGGTPMGVEVYTLQGARRARISPSWATSINEERGRLTAT